MAGIRAEISYMVGKKVNVVIQDLNQFKSSLAIDMVKWAKQRSDMQLDIQHIESQISNYHGKQPDPLHQYFIGSPYLRNKSGSNHHQVNSDKNLSTNNWN